MFDGSFYLLFLLILWFGVCFLFGFFFWFALLFHEKILK